MSLKIRKGYIAHISFSENEKLDFIYFFEMYSAKLLNHIKCAIEKGCSILKSKCLFEYI